MKDENTREVYIGNGVTKHVDTSANNGKLLDIEKLQKIIDDKPNKKIAYGMSEDWFFTAETVTGKKIKEMSYVLGYSDWATPIVEVDEDRVNCYIEIPKKLHGLSYSNGFKAGTGKFDFWVTDFYNRKNKLKYPLVREFFEEVNLLLKKYETKELSG